MRWLFHRVLSVWIGCTLVVQPFVVSHAVGPQRGLLVWGEDRPRPLPIHTFSGKSCLRLIDVATWVGGHLHWYPVSERVDLTVRSHAVQFFYGSNKALVDGAPQRLEIPAVKDKDGLWVPISFF